MFTVYASNYGFDDIALHETDSLKAAKAWMMKYVSTEDGGNHEGLHITDAAGDVVDGLDVGEWLDEMEFRNSDGDLYDLHFHPDPHDSQMWDLWREECAAD